MRQDRPGKEVFREREVGPQRGGKEQEMPSRGTREEGGQLRCSGRAAEERGKRKSRLATRGQVMPRDLKTGAGRAGAKGWPRRAYGAVQAQWEAPRRPGQGMKGQHRQGQPGQYTEKPSNRSASGQVAGRPGPTCKGGSKEEGPPTAQTGPTGTEGGPYTRPEGSAQIKAARRQSFGLEHPGDVDLRARTGKSGADRGKKRAASGTGAAGGRGRKASDRIIQDGTKRRSPQRTNYSIQRGQAAGMEQMEPFNSGNKETSHRNGAKKREKRQEAPDKSIRDGAARREGGHHPEDH